MTLDRRSLLGAALATTTLPAARLAQAQTPAPLVFGVGMFQPDREKNDATYRPLAIAFDAPAWQGEFLRQWPPGSDAHVSLVDRLVRGPDHRPSDAVRVEE